MTLLRKREQIARRDLQLDRLDPECLVFLIQFRFFIDPGVKSVFLDVLSVRVDYEILSDTETFELVSLLLAVFGLRAGRYYFKDNIRCTENGRSPRPGSRSAGHRAPPCSPRMCMKSFPLPGLSPSPVSSSVWGACTDHRKTPAYPLLATGQLKSLFQELS